VQFDPILPTHAIERCAVTITFNEALPEKLFQLTLTKHEERISKSGLSKKTTPNVGFVIDVATGNVTRGDVSMAPRTFSTPDDSTQLTLFPNAIVFVTTAYLRWKPFLEHFLAVSTDVLGDFTESLTAKTVKVEVWDRFLWDDSWKSLDYASLFREECPYIVKFSLKPEKEWHSHAGWFEYGGNKERRLVNINVDVVEVVSNRDGQKHPSVVIYTFMQDELTSDEPFNASDRLGNLHLALKKLFGELVVDEIKERVGLGSLQ